MKTAALLLLTKSSLLLQFFGIATLQQQKAISNIPGGYLTYFFAGLVIGVVIALTISRYFLRSKVRRLSSQMHGLAKTPKTESVELKEESAGKSNPSTSVIDIHTDKVPPLHEKEIESLVKLASTLSHDLNNLAGSIMGYASLLKKRVQPETKEFHYAEIIEHSSKQIAQLVKRVLGFSQLDTKTLKVVDLNQFVRVISEEFSSVHGGKYNVIVSPAPQPIPVRISTDQLNQVILAILSNAADSMKDGGTIECSISLSEESAKPGNSTKSQCLIEIEDHGTGMDEEVRQRIFEPFFTTKNDKKYTGLSLSQVFNIVKQHDGAISVDSLLGVGTKVRIRFPLYAQEEAPASRETASTTIELKGCKILVVDDEENVRQLGFDVLTEHGFHVITANNGLDALQKLKDNPDVQLVILDMIMPVMTGKDACIEMKKMEHPPKILICTGFSELSDLKTILGTYAEGLIRKPYNTRELVDTVESLLREISQ